METEFWRGKWRDGQLGWHRPSAHPMLVRHLPALGLNAGARIFLPLCGKTLDVGWLAGQGFCVAGAELVESAVEQLFAELGLTPDIGEAGRLRLHRAEGIEIFVGDVFDLVAQDLGAVAAVFDRAALVALPAQTRPAYAAHLAAVTARAPQLLVTFDYDEALMAGPPFSVAAEEVGRLYAGVYDVAPLESAEVEGGLKGFCPAVETVWRLTPR